MDGFADWMPRRRDSLRAGVAWAMGAAAGGVPALAAGQFAAGPAVAWPRVRLLDGRVLEAPVSQQRAAVIVFFATTCGFCKRHNQHVQKLLRASAGQPLQVLGVAHDRRSDVVQQHLAEQGWTFDVTLDEAPLHAVLSARRVTPLTCVLDRQGRLREVIPGEMFEDDVLGLARWARA